MFEILLWYVQTGSWKEAFERVIPLRKIDKKEPTDESATNEQTSEQQTNKQEIEHKTSKQTTDEQEISKQETGTEQRTCKQTCTS